MGVSKNSGTPKWMGKIMENPMNKWMIWGVKPPLFLVQTPIYIYKYPLNTIFKVFPTPWCFFDQGSYSLSALQLLVTNLHVTQVGGGATEGTEGWIFWKNPPENPLRKWFFDSEPSIFFVVFLVGVYLTGVFCWELVSFWCSTRVVSFFGFLCFHHQHGMDRTCNEALRKSPFEMETFLSPPMLG